MTAPDIGATLTRLLAATPPRGLVSAYLFGSHADGRAHRESDVDLGVLLGWELYRTRSERFDERVRLSAWLAAELRVPVVDVVVLNDAHRSWVAESSPAAGGSSAPTRRRTTRSCVTSSCARPTSNHFSGARDE